IETLTKAFGTDILISEDSYRLVTGIFRTVPMQKITVKGKKDPQQIYAVLGRIDDPKAPATIEELRGILGTTEQPFRRRHDDPHQEEVKYEIIET
ncbi:MAG TPA: adenylate/guanylate cyclase domain-containing protein, partial [Spirochaetota bacterium]|nr:adenylate/guanylate cyclase domain-containing protein [Spirochaetota bacterium]